MFYNFLRFALEIYNGFMLNIRYASITGFAMCVTRWNNFKS